MTSLHLGMLGPMAEKVPRLLAGLDIRTFKLAPTDGFLIARIDGKRGPKELARETGLPDFSVASALEKLEKLGVIEIVDPNAPPRMAAPPPEPPRQRTVSQFEDGLLAPKYDPSELDEPADLLREQKKRVLDFFYRLDDLDHYTLLGITQSSDKKGVKRAYFELAALFHPDRYYRKSLGSFKPKMEELFNRITEAHDTLVDPVKRKEYDAYLAEIATTRGMEAMFERAIADTARLSSTALSVGNTSTPPAVSPPTSPTSEVREVRDARATDPSASPRAPSAEEIQRRKEALARRLMAGQHPRSTSPPENTAKPTAATESPLRYSNSGDAMDALKRRYHERLENATQAHAQRYVQSAEDALAKNDLVTAATALGVATKFSPDDADLAARAANVRTMADKTLCETHLKQAQSEERQGHWLEASRLWTKVAKLQNDATSHERAANAILRSPGGDLREAAEHAKQALMLSPNVIDVHLTLVEIYVKAGLTASARRAAEMATALDPKNPAVQALSKRIGKG